MSERTPGVSVITAPSPPVSIGLPVFNGEGTIEAVIESLLAQSFADFILLISDNCSTDATQEICERYARQDARIRYFRQSNNIGAAANFAFVLAQTDSDFFMWNAADDLRSPDFIEANLSFLLQAPDFVASTSPTRFTDGSFDPVRMGDAALLGAANQNFIAFFNAWHANGRFYSLFRRAILTNCASIHRSFFGSDWALILECCQHGRFQRLDKGWTVLGRGGISQSPLVFSMFRTHWRERFVPFLELSKVVLALSRGFPLSVRVRLLARLSVFNVAALTMQLRASLRNLRAAPRQAGP